MDTGVVGMVVVDCVGRVRGAGKGRGWGSGGVTERGRKYAFTMEETPERPLKEIRSFFRPSPGICSLFASNCSPTAPAAVAIAGVGVVSGLV